MAKPKKFDQFSFHEVMDRASASVDQFHEQVATHPLVDAVPELAELCEKAMDALTDVYSHAGKVLVETWPDSKRVKRRPKRVPR